MKESHGEGLASHTGPGMEGQNGGTGMEGQIPYYRKSSRSFVLGTVWPAQAGGQIAYNGLGRRISKAISSCGDWDGVYHYFYDGQQCVEDRNGSGKMIRQYVHGLGYIDELAQVGVDTDPNGGANSIGVVRYICQDANYNVVGVVTDNGGHLVERREYTPYGEATVFSPS